MENEMTWENFTHPNLEAIQKRDEFLKNFHVQYNFKSCEFIGCDCLNCSHSLSDENDVLHCAMKNFEVVSEDEWCEDWN